MAFRHAPSLTFSLDSVEVEALPSHRVLLSRWSSVLWPPPTSHPASSWISPLRLIPFVTLAVVHRWMRSLLFHRLLSQHLVLLTPEGPTRLHFQVLRRFHGLRGLVSSSAPFFSRFRANISVLQDSLYVTVCCFAPLSQGDTMLRHSQSPSCTGCLLYGFLSVATTGLAPVSSR